MFDGCKTGSTLPVSNQILQCAEVMATVLFVPVMVIYVYASDTSKDFEEHERFTQGLTKVLLEGRTEGARRFFVAGEQNVEEDEEMKERSKDHNVGMDVTQTREGSRTRCCWKSCRNSIASFFLSGRAVRREGERFHLE